MEYVVLVLIDCLKVIQIIYNIIVSESLVKSMCSCYQGVWFYLV